MRLRITAKAGPGHTPHSLRAEAENVPKGCVLLGVLKSVENELRRRDMLGVVRPSTPLWFLAETERNIFLWRNGRSIADQGDFSFWVDVPALISKRREQLSRAEEANPFTNPVWGAHQFDDKLADQEREYLDSVEELIATVLKHAEALSVASETIRSEICAGSLPRAPIILPARHGSGEGKGPPHS